MTKFTITTVPYSDKEIQYVVKVRKFLCWRNLDNTGDFAEQEWGIVDKIVALNAIDQYCIKNNVTSKEITWVGNPYT